MCLTLMAIIMYLCRHGACDVDKCRIMLDCTLSAEMQQKLLHSSTPKTEVESRPHL
jgi:hypothetical protein